MKREKQTLAWYQDLRGWVLVCAVALVPGLLGAVHGSTDEPPVIRARQIQLVDDDGRVRAELAIDEKGSAGLFVRDTQGRTRARVIHDDDQSALFLMDDQGTIRVGAAQFAHGGGGFALHGPESKGGAVMYFKSTGSVTVFDSEGQTQHRWPAE